MKIFSITKSADFSKIKNTTTKFFSSSVILLQSPTPFFYFDPPHLRIKNKNPEAPKKASTDFCRIGYIVSKTVGNAITRNKAKRRLRAIFATLAPNYCALNTDYVLIARKEISTLPFEKISSDVKFCLKRIGTKK